MFKYNRQVGIEKKAETIALKPCIKKAGGLN